MSQENPFKANPYLYAILCAAEDEAWIKVRLNGAYFMLPAGTILTMAHCLHLDGDGNIELYVETAHLLWMRERLKAGSIFLDVGAATGAMSLPIAHCHPGVHMIAFEPAERARRLLISTLVKNNLMGVTVINAAVSNLDGKVYFAEKPVSEDGSLPFLPETSSITGVDDENGNAKVFEVESIRLNTLGKIYGMTDQDIVIKIDIEGYEIQALQGADELLANNNVCLAIDIHDSPDGNGTTEQGCRDLLASYGYANQSMMGHVLLAERV